MTMQRSRILKSLVLELAVSGSALAQCQYSVQTYPPFDCGFWGDVQHSGLGLNNLGGWSGYRDKCTPGTGFLPVYCPPGGTPQVLPLPPGAGPKGAWAYGVNDAGVVAGVSYEGPNGVPEKGAVWWPDGSVTIIPPTNGTYSPAYAINNFSAIVGANQGKPYIWQDGVMTEIDPSPFNSGVALCVSDAGHVSGYCGNSNADGRAFLWHEGVLAILEPVGNHLASEGRGVNSSGVVVGISRTYLGAGLGYASTPTVWTRNSASALPLPPGYLSGSCVGINDSGVMIGGAAAVPGTELSSIRLIWANGEVFPVNALTVPGSPNIGSVVGINHAGQILSGGSAKLLSPIGASPADLNGDCAVNGADLALILSEWGPVLQPGSAGDINGDGTVDGTDLGLLLSAWSP